MDLPISDTNRTTAVKVDFFSLAMTCLILNLNLSPSVLTQVFLLPGGRYIGGNQRQVLSSHHCVFAMSCTDTAGGATRTRDPKEQPNLHLLEAVTAIEDNGVKTLVLS